MARMMLLIFRRSALNDNPTACVKGVWDWLFLFSFFFLFALLSILSL